VQGFAAESLAWEGGERLGVYTCSVNGYNIQIAPCEPWAVSDIHNSFVWVDTYLNALFEELSSEKYAAKKPSARERILDR